MSAADLWQEHGVGPSQTCHPEETRSPAIPPQTRHCEQSEAIQPSGNGPLASPASPAQQGFAALHPGVALAYFVIVILLSVCVPHPVLLACSAAGALLYCLQLKGAHATGKLLAGLVPLVLFAALVNALFNHQGVTILGHAWGAPITREALLYGAALAVMLAAVLLWFSCYNVVITSEKFLATVGRAVPSLALVISMALCFVPRYLKQLRRIAAAQRGLGRDAQAGNLRARLSSGFAQLSILTSWALESAIDTADSMHARGYGLPGRSAYAPFRFTDYDAGTLALMLVCTAPVVLALLTGVVNVQYLPTFLLNQSALAISPALRTGIIAVAYGAFALLCLLPVLMTLREELAWHISRSTI